jgi:hypothetical protein
MRDCCRKILFGAWMGVVLLAFSGGTAWTGSPGELKSLVPPEHMDQAKSFINPFTPTEEFIANGKRLYDGKGWCAFCHGWEEGGSPSVRRRNVPSGFKLPTNFQDAAWQAARSDGEDLLDPDPWESWYRHGALHADVYYRQRSLADHCLYPNVSRNVRVCFR